MTDYQLIGILSIDSYRMRYMEVLFIVLSFKSNKNEIEKFLQDMKNILEDESFNIHDNIKVVKSKKKEEKEKKIKHSKRVFSKYWMLFFMKNGVR